MARYLAGLALAAALALPSVASALPPVSGALTQLPGLAGCISNDGSSGLCTDGFGLGGAYNVAVSPDGANVYVPGSGGYLAVFRRDPASGALTETQCFSFDGTDTGGGTCTDARGINDPVGIAVSPDGRFVYVGDSSAQGEISIYARDPATGALTQLPGTQGCISNDGSSEDGAGTCEQGRGFSYAYQLAMSPDGSDIYAADDAGAGGVAVLRRDATTGTLSQSAGPDGCISNDGTAVGGGSCADGRAMSSAEGIDISPDGRTVYVGTLGGELAVLQRDSSGSLVQSSGPDGCFSEDGNASGGLAGSCTRAIALGDIYRLTVAPDGRNVYTTGFSSSEVAVFARNASTGALTQPAGTAACVSDSGDASNGGGGLTGACVDGRGLGGAFPLAVSPAGDSLYVGGYSAAEMAAFARDPVSGAVTQLSGKSGCLSSNGDDASGAPGNGLCGMVPTFTTPTGIAVSPDGTSAYVSDGSASALVAFRRETAPTCQGQTVSVAPRTPTSVALHCSDADGDPVGLSIASPPGSGSLGAIAAGGIVTYTPQATFAGQTSFTFAASDGTNSSTPATVTLQVQSDHTPPLLSRLRLVHAVFRVGKARTPLVAAARRHPIGTTFAFALSEPARVAVVIQRALPGRRVGHACRKPSARLRHRKACTRYVTVGTLRRSGAQGPNRVNFSGRLGRRALKPARYRARFVATDPSGNRSNAHTLKFRVVKH